MSMRLFVALEAPDPVVVELRRALEVMRRALPKARLRGAVAAGAHLTLRFLGQTPEEALPALERAMGTATHGLHGFTLRTGGAGAFPSLRRPSVVWLGVEGDTAALARLHERVADALRGSSGDRGTEEPTGYLPHLTLARLGPLSAPQREALAGACSRYVPAGVPWAVSAVSLVRSTLTPTGAHHRTLVHAPLTPRRDG